MQKIDSRGGTAMRDAISMSIDYLKEKGKKDKKVILVVTDGNDTASMETLEKLVAKARQSEVLIYGIGILGEEEPRESKKAQRALKALTDASGGMVFYPKTATGRGEDVARSRARDSKPVHHRLLANIAGARRQFPADQSHR